MNDTVLWGVDRRGVATVTLNRPQVNNAYNGDLIAGLHAAMDALGRELSLRIVVLFATLQFVRVVSAVERARASALLDTEIASPFVPLTEIDGWLARLAAQAPV